MVKYGLLTICTGRYLVSGAYYIFRCEANMAVNKQMHSDRFVEKMSAGHKVTYLAVPNRGHCDLTDEMRARYNEYIMESVAGMV